MRRIALFALCLGVLSMVVGWYLAYGRTQSIVERCADAEHTNSCYNDVVDEVFKTKGLAAAFDALAAAYDADPSYLSTCHAETHELGKAAYAEFHATGAVELTQKTSYCGYGFYHGFIEELVSETNDLDEARTFCAYAGRVVPRPTGYAEGACYHGIGHGVTDGTDPRLWGDAKRIVEPGLALCAKVASGQRNWQYRCDSGVFNSVALLYRDPKYKITVKDENAFLLCESDSFTEVEKEACFDQMNTLAMRVADYDFAKAIDSIRKISEDTYRLVALRGISGMYFSSARNHDRMFSPKEVSDVCATLGSNGDACIVGIIGGIQEFGTPGSEYNDMRALCSSPDLKEEFTHVCYDRMILSTQQFYGDEVANNVCGTIPEKHRNEVCTL